jgi:hypothetical protein
MLDIFFGEPIRLLSPLPYEECLQRIRGMRARWNDYKADGPWGYGFLSWQWLWTEPGGRRSPTISLRLKRDGQYTRIIGRANPNPGFAANLYIPVFLLSVCAYLTLQLGWRFPLIWLMALMALVPSTLIILMRKETDTLDPVVEKIKANLNARNLADD